MMNAFLFLSEYMFKIYLLTYIVYHGFYSYYKCSAEIIYKFNIGIQNYKLLIFLLIFY